MRLSSRLVIILVTCLIAIPLLAVPAQAEEAVPSISLSPASGIPGTEVTVRGQNFTAGSYVDICYDLNGDGKCTGHEWLVYKVIDSTGHFRVDFTVPESYKGKHMVRAEEDSDVGLIADAFFRVEPELTISPDEGPVGTTVTVEGHGFAEDEEDIELMYYLNGSPEVVAQNIEADEDGSWETSLQIPPSPKGDHKIDAEGHDTSSSEVEDVFFEVRPLISLGKTSGSPGQSISMTGSGFYGRDRYIKIIFAGEETETEPEIIRAGDNGNWSASFQVPEMPNDEYSVTAKGELTRDANLLSFTIGPGLLLSPDEGHVGMNVTVTGHGFTSDEDVDITYDGSHIETAETDNKGSFDITFTVPESSHGHRVVSAEDATGNNATTTFTMESDRPDIPDLVSPADGDRVGFIGKITPTFEWSAVSDDSGVYYSLQIASSENMTATGEFTDPIVSKEGLVATNYTLKKTEALPYGTYYWIVQAVDGAQNTGEWSEPFSFRAGVMPLWAFILIIVGVVAGIGTGLYFFIMRRRMYY